MAQDRTAVDTIRGYYYQFDYYILQLLQLDQPTDTVCIEGIEDVDIYNTDEITAVQCKYYSKTEYNHSVIAKPIRLMVINYKNNPAKRKLINYKLYGNFLSGQNKLPQIVDADFLKNHFLTYTDQTVKHELHKELGLTDNEICDFLNHISININAISYEEQERLVILKLKELFMCSEFEAEYYYYNNALRLVKRLASNQDIAKRTISKTVFTAKINKKKMLFDCWFLDLKGREKYCKAVKSQYFSPMNISPCERFFLFDCDNLISEIELKKLILKVSRNWSKLSKKEPKPFCPYIYLHNASRQKIVNIKKSIQNDNIYFWDGYNFKDSDFSLRSLVRKATGYNDIQLKFITELEQLEEVLEFVTTTRIIYQFYITEPFYTNEQYEHYYIPIRNTQDIALIV